MTYQVLARKWRPQDFSSLVGQEHVVTALRNGLAEDRIAQAYLFSGIRGVGKTTAARVLAKALNCEKAPAADPCNVCTSCVEITAGSSLDVIEVDAATYSKVEQVRELTESLRYGPSQGRFKVVVLDEVHRLSRQAFDALLKIVEEPPAHLVFIFATTEIDAVPATILSRCQEFQFRRVPQAVLSEHLRYLSEQENIQASDSALRLIARAGEGSVRDSVALLDQMSTFGSGTISDEDAAKLLGGLDAAIFQGLLAAILTGDSPVIVKVVRDIDANGWDPHNVYGQFLNFSRDALHVAIGGSDDALEVPPEEADRLRATVKPHGYESLLQVLQLLLSSEASVKRSEFGLLALEIAWLRAAELPKVAKIQELLSGSGGPSGGSRQASSDSPGERRTSSSRPLANSAVQDEPSASPAPVIASAPTQETAAASEPTAITESTAATQPAAESRASDDQAPPIAAHSDPLDASRLPDLLELIGNRRQSLAAHLAQARLSLIGRKLLIEPPAGDTLLIQALERVSNTKALAKALERIWGVGVQWSLGAASRAKSSSTKTSAANSSAASTPAICASAEQGHPATQTALGGAHGSHPSPYRESSGPSRLANAVPATSAPAAGAQNEPQPTSQRSTRDQGAWGPPSGGQDWRSEASQQHHPRGPAHHEVHDGGWGDDSQHAEVRQLPVVKAFLEGFGGHIKSVRDGQNLHQETTS